MRNGLNLVTGASGFLGSWVVRKLVVAGWPVRAMVRPTSNLWNLSNIAANVEIARGDKADKASLTAALEGCTRLFDCAVDVRTWVSQTELDRTNVAGTRNLLEAAFERGVERVVFCSAAGTIGRGTGPVATEDNPFDWWDRADPYLRSRVLAEREIATWVARGLPVVIVNPTVTWGPGDSQPTPQGRMVIDFLKGRIPCSIPVRMCVADVEDAADMMIAAAARGRPGERYLIGGENLWMREIFHILAELSGVPPPRFELPLPLTYVVAGVSSLLNRIRGRPQGFTLRTLRIARGMPPYATTKAQTELGYRPRPTREVFTRTIEWFRANGYFDGKRRG